MARVVTQRIPSYFYSCTNPIRWRDPYSHPDDQERLILTPNEIVQRGKRNEAYANWLVRHGLKNKLMRWQVIQILRFKHSESSRRDWWERYQDCLFRVWVSPETLYCKDTKQYKQWYVLCPEDSELLLRYEFALRNPELPPRSPLSEPYFSKFKHLRKARLVPVECCRHWRHETTAGALPLGL